MGSGWVGVGATDQRDDAIEPREGLDLVRVRVRVRVRLRVRVRVRVKG